ncbi:hypothetical protein BOTNAR_0337g00100 [Botryotinia narcissicola]|uniref:Tyrosine specific protein phosphatases domain-containing protein n=1 Tax=Botryotinia narcissicola TaxID=278944 RepID=A0A4Z1HTG5_9HELO|nr:hypothetical protein BOTNAR_0337g00100 [Botryotinia narcissicola]
MACSSGAKPTLVNLLQTPISQSIPADIVESTLSQPPFLRIPYALDVRTIPALVSPDFTGEGGKTASVKMYGEGILEEYKMGIRKVFEKIGEAEGGNILFHCTAGKNHTGVIAAVILASFGASEKEIALDYALTRIGTEPHRERSLKGILKWIGERGLKQPGLDGLSCAKGEKIIAFSSWMNVKWGGYVRQNVNYCEHVEDIRWSGVERCLTKECGFERNELEKTRRAFI